MSIQSRIVRGIGYGAIAVSMLGFAVETTPAEVIEVIRSGGGLYSSPQIKTAQAQTITVKTGHIILSGKVLEVTQTRKVNSEEELIALILLMG